MNITVELNMSREFMSRNKIGYRAGDAIDSLVINFDGSSTDLTQEKFEFDIDVDGRLDSISFVGSGSGFLAIDLNADNVINDGRELLGPQSGDGFDELLKYDEDGNNWIDENDSVYSDLVI